MSPIIDPQETKFSHWKTNKQNCLSTTHQTQSMQTRNSIYKSYHLSQPTTKCMLNM